MARTASHLSMSHIKLADRCTQAEHYHYVDKIPAPMEAAAMLFGIVVHNGTEQWYGDPGSDNHQHVELPDLIHAEWFARLPTDIATALRHCIKAERDQEDLAQLIKLARPTIKSPRQTKDFEVSDEKKRFEDARDQLLQLSDACETHRWPKDENAFQAYQKSLVIGRQLQERWRRFPRPIYVEYEFTIEFAGVEVRGRIDQIRADPDPMGEVKVEGLDLKTGRQLLTQMEAFLQAFLYDEACHQLPELPIPDYWTYWMARQNAGQHGRIDRERHGKLAKRILDRVRRQIETDDPAPQFGMWCKSCDFYSLCEQEISIWPPGEKSMVLGALTA